MARTPTLTKRRLFLLASLAVGLCAGAVVAVAGRDWILAAAAGLSVASLLLALDAWRTAGRTRAAVRTLRARVSPLARQADRSGSAEATIADLILRLAAVEDRTIELADMVAIQARHDAVS